MARTLNDKYVITFWRKTQQLLTTLAVPRLPLRNNFALLQGHRSQQAEKQARFQTACRQAWQAEAAAQRSHLHAECDGSRVSGKTRYGRAPKHQKQRKGMLSASTNIEQR
jgi:hypothetical protein